MSALTRTFQAMSAADALDRLSPTKLAIVAFSRGEIDASALAVRLSAAGWSASQVDKLVASARANLRRVQA